MQILFEPLPVVCPAFSVLILYVFFIRIVRMKINDVHVKKKVHSAIAAILESALKAIVIVRNVSTLDYWNVFVP